MKTPGRARLLSLAEVEAVGKAALERDDEATWQLANEVHQIRSRVRGGELVAESLVSAVDGRGRVKVTWHDEMAFLDVSIAEALGTSILEAAAAARIDASLLAVLGSMGLDPAAASNVLRAVREQRAREDERPPS